MKEVIEVVLNMCDDLGITPSRLEITWGAIVSVDVESVEYDEDSAERIEDTLFCEPNYLSASGINFNARVEVNEHDVDLLIVLR
jgi:hypothetical protein